jgi:hypothetical protein
LGTKFASAVSPEPSWDLSVIPGRVEEGKAMHHTIEFVQELAVDLEVSPRHWLEKMVIRPGTRVQAQIKPYVVETADGPVEVADLFFADGTAARRVPFEAFSLVD